MKLLDLKKFLFIEQTKLWACYSNNFLFFYYDYENAINYLLFYLFIYLSIFQWNEMVFINNFY